MIKEILGDLYWGPRAQDVYQSNSPSTNWLEEDKVNISVRASEKNLHTAVESRWKHVPLRDRKPPRRARRDHLEATHVQCRETRRRGGVVVEWKVKSVTSRELRNHGLISEKRWTHERVDKSREIPHRKAPTWLTSEYVDPTMLNWIDIYSVSDKLDRLITNYGTPIRSLQELERRNITRDASTRINYPVDFIQGASSFPYFLFHSKIF